MRRWVTGTANKYNFEVFSLGETEGVRTLTNVAGIPQYSYYFGLDG